LYAPPYTDVTWGCLVESEYVIPALLRIARRERTLTSRRVNCLVLMVVVVVVVADPPPSVAHVFSRKKIKRRERNHWFDVDGKGLYLSSRNVDPSTKLIDSSGGSLYVR
jgi:hypothetical protein